MDSPLFSILHPSARPHKWREIYESWISAAAHPESVEYVLCVDERWGFKGHQSMTIDDTLTRAVKAGQFLCVWNGARRCYVDAVNLAARASTGRILIVIADDQYPCEGWDDRLFNKFGYVAALKRERGETDLVLMDWIDKEEFVISVSTGTPQEHERGIMVMPILSRARYERLGYVLYPEYESAFADNDIYYHAGHDKCVIEARHLMFPHRHPLAEPGAWEKRADGQWITRDKAYAAQNRPEAYELGAEVFRLRQIAKFENVSPLLFRGESWVMPLSESVDEAQYVLEDNWKRFMDRPAKPLARLAKPKGIALALPGESFSHVWVAKLLELLPALMNANFNFCPLLIHTSEPGITRAQIAKTVLEMRDKNQFSPDFILWIDDDQILEPAQVLMLIADMEQFPDADMIAGWTWIASSGPHENAPQVSCGRMDLSKGELSHAEYRSVQAAGGVFEVGWTGFPVVLMRTGALDKTGKHPFSHYPCPDSPWGECGEDISFCKRLTDAGGKIMVDSRVFVPHLKLKALGPVPASKEEIGLALTGQSGMSTCSAVVHIPPSAKEEMKREEEERRKSFKLVVGEEMMKLNADAARYAARVFEDLT